MLDCRALGPPGPGLLARLRLCQRVDSANGRVSCTACRCRAPFRPGSRTHWIPVRLLRKGRLAAPVGRPAAGAPSTMSCLKLGKRNSGSDTGIAPPKKFDSFLGAFANRRQKSNSQAVVPSSDASVDEGASGQRRGAQGAQVEKPGESSTANDLAQTTAIDKVRGIPASAVQSEARPSQVVVGTPRGAEGATSTSGTGERAGVKRMSASNRGDDESGAKGHEGSPAQAWEAGGPDLHHDMSGLHARPKARIKLTDAEVLSRYTHGDTSAPDPEEPPYFGVWALQGKRTAMEDACTLISHIAGLVHRAPSGMRDMVPAPLASLYSPELARNSDGDPPPRARAGAEEPGTADAPVADTDRESIHFVGLFDGHGGEWASQYCAKVLHIHFANRLRKLVMEGESACSDPYDPERFEEMVGTDAREVARQEGGVAQYGDFRSMTIGAGASQRAIESMGERPVSAPSSEHGPDGAPGRIAALEMRFVRPRVDTVQDGVTRRTEPWMICDALRMAFLTTHIGFRQQKACELVGSTSVAVVCTRTHLYIANCGDSRAVLKRGARVLPLTCDQKPARQDEADRVVAAGGKIYMTDGYRINGVLAMTRAIGDVALERAGVVPDPELTVLERSDEDEVIVVASDGLWEVMSNDMAVDTACKAIARVQQKGHTRNVGCKHAAKVIANHALKVGSSDNISVVVLDLKKSNWQWQ